MMTNEVIHQYTAEIIVGEYLGCVDVKLVFLLC